ncbi:MAG: hypothetical protein RL357_387 [Pseudomonadota bacterium]
MTHPRIPINLNSDLGEWVNGVLMGDDDAMLRVVNSANIACGFHASDPAHIAQTMGLARKHGVELGAHPSFDDAQGFGRQPMQLPTDALMALVTYQVGAMQCMAKMAGSELTHVKPHGALSNMACTDLDMAHTIAEAIAGCSPDLILLAPACSALAVAGQTFGLRTALEIYADRRYESDGQLVSRRQPNAMVSGPTECVQHVMAMLEAGGIVTQSGEVLPSPIHSVCVHGDDAHAVATAQSLREALIGAGYDLTPLSELV